MRAWPVMTALTMILATAVLGQPHGLEERVANEVLLFPEIPATTPEPHVAQRVFPDLTFPGARRLVSAPGTGEYIILTPDGIWSFDPDTAATSTQWLQAPADTEFIDLVFSGNWMPGDDLLLTSFVGDGDVGTLKISVYTHGSNQLQPALWSLENVDRATAGGSLVRLADGQLLLGLGDLGQPDQIGASDYAGSILPLDAETFQPQPRMATGLRQPFLAADPVMGSLFVLDFVPDGPWEANRVEEGMNFGWPTLAGFGCWPPGSTCSGIGFTRPVYTSPFNASDGFVAGAFAYDPGAPDLHGWFVTINSATGEVGAIRDTGGMFLSHLSLTSFAPGALTGVGSDDEGRVFLLADGGVYTLRPADGEPNAFPTRLSQMDAFLAAGRGQDQTGSGIIPYRPSATLWTDNARKERFLALPGLSQIGFREEDGWDFPVGGGVVKNFILPTDERDGLYQEKRVETRLLLKSAAGWRGFTYRWNEGETDAILLPRSLNRAVSITEEDGASLDYEWFYPSRTDCFECHTNAANTVLGLNTAQMNYEITYPETGVQDNQLRALDHISVFSSPLPAAPGQLDRMPAQDDTSASIALRARAFLHSNCAFCHRPNGGGQIGTDFRWSTPLHEMGIVNDRPSGFDLDIEDAYLLLPGHPGQSVLPARMETLDPAYKMPPLARRRVAEDDLALIRQWITDMKLGEAWTLY